MAGIKAKCELAAAKGQSNSALQQKVADATRDCRSIDAVFR
jgi:hypothetical protein